MRGPRAAPALLAALCAAALASGADRVVFSAKEPGEWAGKEGKHVPLLTVADGVATIHNLHGQSKEHHITRHWLEDASGRQVGAAHPWSTEDEVLRSRIPLPKSFTGTVTAFAHCNEHGIWRSAPVKVAGGEL
mmetsp:Transcript_7645/g.20578  ORF Transcript_7645/g.20578 Transcript_7645/m.20578 type:complete len:133 (+) Transcript_7645:2-400(+)